MLARISVTLPWFSLMRGFLMGFHQAGVLGGGGAQVILAVGVIDRIFQGFLQFNQSGFLGIELGTALGIQFFLGRYGRLCRALQRLPALGG